MDIAIGWPVTLIRFRLSAGAIAVILIALAASEVYQDFHRNGPVGELIWAIVGRRLLCGPTLNVEQLPVTVIIWEFVNRWLVHPLFGV